MAKYNRTTTLESLVAFVGLICCDTKEQFCYYYRLAAKDDNGASAWYRMYIQKGGINER